MLKVLVIGNLGNDPEMRYAATGQAVLRCNVACNYRGKNEANEWTDKTEWVRVTVFGKRAETLAELLRKGSRVYVDGRLEARPWIDNSGSARAGLEVIGETVELLSPKNEGEQPAPRRTVGSANRAQGDDDDSLPF